MRALHIQGSPQPFVEEERWFLQCYHIKAFSNIPLISLTTTKKNRLLNGGGPPLFAPLIFPCHSLFPPSPPQAKLVASATGNLCEAANSVVQGQAQEEKLIAAAKAVAASTAQLLIACQVKADPRSENNRRLQVWNVYSCVSISGGWKQCIECEWPLVCIKWSSNWMIKLWSTILFFHGVNCMY